MTPSHQPTRLAHTLARLCTSGDLGLAPFLTAGDGGFDVTLAALHGLEAGGAALVELGVPFSDPLADGPRLARAAERAIAAGANLAGVLALVRRYRAEGGTLPIVIFSYANPLLARPRSARAELGAAADNLLALAEAGADGLLVPDAPLEELPLFASAADDAGLALCTFVAPTSAEERVRWAAREARGFVYAIGRTGVTGAATATDAPWQASIARLRGWLGEAPLAVGFGLGSARQVDALRGLAQLAVIGTALVDALHDAVEAARAADDDPCAAVHRRARLFMRSLAGMEFEGPAGTTTEGQPR